MRSDAKWEKSNAEKDAIIADNAAKLADKDTEIARLRAELEKHK